MNVRLNVWGDAKVDKVLKSFSFRGRANRQVYWLTGIAIWVSVFAAGTAALDIGVVGATIAAVVLIAASWAGLATAVRRIHDRGRSGWWLLLMLLPAVLLNALASVARASSPDAAAGFSLLGLPFSIWMLVDLGILPGKPGPNRFGEDPLGRVAEVFA